MKARTLIAFAVTAVFALPLAAQPAGDKAKSSDSGAEAMFKSLDKNKDGYVSREEAKGTPYDKDFAKLDRNNDGKLSREEHAAAPEHSGDKAGTGGSPSTDSSRKY